MSLVDAAGIKKPVINVPVFRQIMCHLYVLKGNCIYLQWAGKALCDTAHLRQNQCFRVYLTLLGQLMYNVHIGFRGTYTHAHEWHDAPSPILNSYNTEQIYCQMDK